MSLSGSAKVAAIIGWPVAHTLSPKLHGFWLSELAMDGVLVPLAVKPEDFSTVITALKKSGFKGASVTLPHKEAAFALAHDSDQAARLAGAVNLLIFHQNGRVEGRNTDAEGLGASLRETLKEDAFQAKPALVLGAGGAARAAVVALQGLGVCEIRILNRTQLRAEQMARALQPHISTPLLVLNDWSSAAKNAALLIHATSAGMKNTPPLDLDLSLLSPDAVVCDIVYNPLQTRLLKQAHARGLRTVDGLGMLMHQGVAAFEAFFGVRPKVTAQLRQHLEDSLRG